MISGAGKCVHTALFSLYQQHTSQTLDTPWDTVAKGSPLPGSLFYSQARSHHPMSASAAKLAANRANATYSTGPADTSRTRFNGLTHGLTSKQTVIRGEDQQEYDTFNSNLRRQLAPASPTENVLADRVI